MPSNAYEVALPRFPGLGPGIQRKRQKSPSPFHKLLGADLVSLPGVLSERCEVISMAGTDYATVTDYATRRPALPSRINRAMIATVVWRRAAGCKTRAGKSRQISVA